MGLVGYVLDYMVDQVLDHMLDQMLDHMPDQMIIGLMTTALQNDYNI